MAFATEHRPWPLPAGPWVMAQNWHDLLFAHWPVTIEALRAVIPDALVVDTFEGQAWIGVVPFRMSGVRPRLTPSLPWLSGFPELNVRSYVKVGEKPGICFFSLDATNPVAVAVARWLFHLPYYNARISLAHAGDSIRYESRRTHRAAPPAELLMHYRPVGEVFVAAPGTLAHFLTERYCLYAVDRAQRVYRCEIHHPPWPLQRAEVEIERNTMAAAAGIRLPNVEPLLHFARLQRTVVWPIRSVSGEA